MMEINGFDVDPTEVLAVNYALEEVLTVRDLVKYVLENQDEAREKFDLKKEKDA